jgi:hypothetical protein
MEWTMFYLFVALKIPIGLLAWLVWWAVHAEPDPAEAPPPDEDDGGWKRPHPRTPLPRSPRRGPHGDPAPAAPPRVRTAARAGRRPLAR